MAKIHYHAVVSGFNLKDIERILICIYSRICLLFICINYFLWFSVSFTIHWDSLLTFIAQLKWKYHFKITRIITLCHDLRVKGLLK